MGSSGHCFCETDRRDGEQANGDELEARRRPHAPDRRNDRQRLWPSSLFHHHHRALTLSLLLQKARDPRFDSLSGSFKPDLFRNSYSFLAAAQTAELEALRKTATAARRNAALPEEDKEKIEAALVRMESREVTRKNKERDEGALKGWKKEEAGKREAGKKEFYLKKCECPFFLSGAHDQRERALIVPVIRASPFRDGFPTCSGPEGDPPQGQVRHACGRQETPAQGGREAAEEDGPKRQEEHAGKAGRVASVPPCPGRQLVSV